MAKQPTYLVDILAEAQLEHDGIIPRRGKCVLCERADVIVNDKDWCPACALTGTDIRKRTTDSSVLLDAIGKLFTADRDEA